MAHHHARRPQPAHCCRNDVLSSYGGSGCCCCTCCGFSGSTERDPLVEAIAAQLIQTSRCHRYSAFPKSHIPHNHYHPQRPSFQQQQQQQQQTHALLSSLLRRIDALESSLLHLSAPSSYLLRDAAARTIQTHFRAFLVRRSRTLAHLKELALIKAAFSSLRSSLSPHTHFDSEALSDKTMDLLLKLDSIQDSDSMTRDGKRSVTRELIRFLDFVDGVSARRYQLGNKSTRNMRTAHNASKSRVLTGRVSLDCRDSGVDQRELVEKLKARVETIRGFSRVLEMGEEDVELEGFQHLSDDEENRSVSITEKGGVSKGRNGILVRRLELQPRVKKSVSFAERGNLSTVLGSTYRPASREDDSGKGQIGLVDNLSRDVQAIGGLSRETEDGNGGDTKSGGCSQTSDDERNLGTGEHEDRDEHFQYQDGNSVFSAPLPLKMESRVDLMNRRKGIKSNHIKNNHIVGIQP